MFGSWLLKILKISARVLLCKAILQIVKYFFQKFSHEFGIENLSDEFIYFKLTLPLDNAKFVRTKLSGRLVFAARFAWLLPLLNQQQMLWT